MWLSESFGNFITEWNGRSDLTPRAYGMVKLEPEIKVLTSFGKRAYTNELIEQRTIINDLLGGESVSKSTSCTSHSEIKIVHRSLELLPTGRSSRKRFF